MNGRIRFCPECVDFFPVNIYSNHWAACPARARNKQNPGPSSPVDGGPISESPSGKFSGANNGAGDESSSPGLIVVRECAEERRFQWR